MKKLILAALFMSPCLAADNPVAFLYVAGVAVVVQPQPQPEALVARKIPNNIRPKKYNRPLKLQNNYDYGKTRNEKCKSGKQSHR